MVTVTVDEREGLPAFVVDVLGDVESSLVAFGAEGSTVAVDFVGAGTCGAVASVAGEGFHYVEFIVARDTGVVGHRSEVDLADGVRHFGVR